MSESLTKTATSGAKPETPSLYAPIEPLETKYGYSYEPGAQNEAIKFGLAMNLAPELIDELQHKVQDMCDVVGKYEELIGSPIDYVGKDEHVQKVEKEGHKEHTGIWDVDRSLDQNDLIWTALIGGLSQMMEEHVQNNDPITSGTNADLYLLGYRDGLGMVQGGKFAYIVRDYSKGDTPFYVNFRCVQVNAGGVNASLLRPDLDAPMGFDTVGTVAQNLQEAKGPYNVNHTIQGEESEHQIISDERKVAVKVTPAFLAQRVAGVILGGTEFLNINPFGIASWLAQQAIPAGEAALSPLSAGTIEQWAPLRNRAEQDKNTLTLRRRLAVLQTVVALAASVVALETKMVGNFNQDVQMAAQHFFPQLSGWMLDTIEGTADAVTFGVPNIVVGKLIGGIGRRKGSEDTKEDNLVMQLMDPSVKPYQKEKLHGIRALFGRRAQVQVAA